MTRHRRSSVDPLDELLAELPDNFIARAMQGAWFVAGPPGAYVVVSAPGSGSGGVAPVDLGRLATDVRAVLAGRLTLVPFVQPLLVGSDRPQGAPRTTVVAPDLLLDVLIRGRAILDEQSLARLAAIADAGALDGLGSRASPPTRGWVRASPID